MSKELTPLEAFQLFFKELKIEDSEFARIIETALKRLEELEIENSKQFKEKWVQDNLAMTFELNVVKDKLKALEIIKEKRVDVDRLLRSKDLGEYNFSNAYVYQDLTQDEYDLLREVLL